MFKFPSPRIFLKGIVKELTSYHGLSQDVQCSCWFSISVWFKLDNVLRVGYDRLQLIFLQLHIIHDLVGRTTTGRKILVPFLFSQILKEGIQAFIHPSPLTLI